MSATTSKVPPSRPLIIRILVRKYAYRHPRAWGGVTLAASVWLLILGAILCSGGYWWGVALIATAVLETCIAYSLLHSARG